METNSYTTLLTLLRPLGRRLRLRSGVDLLGRSAYICLLGCAGLLLLGRLTPLAGHRLLAAGLSAAWLLGWALYSSLRPIRPLTVARRADAELGLRDRLSTALALATPGGNLPGACDPRLVSLQIGDALAVAQAIDPRRAFALRLPRLLLVRAAVALLACLALLALPNPMDAVVRQRAQIAQAARAEAARLERLAQALAQEQSLTPEDKAELLRQMRPLIAQLKANPGEASEALADLAALQEQLRARLDPAAPTEQAALEALARQMAALAGANDRAPEAAEAAHLLAQLSAELDRLSPDSRAALAGALEQAAARTMGNDPNLASALSALAQATRTGTDVNQAAARAGPALQRSAGRLAWQQALAQAMGQAEASQRAIARAAAGGQARSPGQSQGQGQGQGQQPGGGGGTNANTLPPGQSSGTAGAPAGPNKPFGVGELEMVYSPLAAGQGQEEYVAGQQGAEGETASGEGKQPQPGASGPALVPYHQVYAQYRQIAGQAMERSYVPAGLQEYVQEYFSALEP